MEDNAPSQKDERIMTQSPASPHLKSYRELTGFMNGRLMTGKKQKKKGCYTGHRCCFKCLFVNLEFRVNAGVHTNHVFHSKITILPQAHG